MLYNTNAAKGATRNPSRRTFLKIAPAAAVAAAAADANASPAAVTPELAELIARYAQIKGRENAAWESVCTIEETEEFKTLATIKLNEVVSVPGDYPKRLMNLPVASEEAISDFFESVNGMFSAVTRTSANPITGLPRDEGRRQMERGDDYRRALELLKVRRLERDEWLRSVGYFDLHDISSGSDGTCKAVLLELIAFPCRSYADVVAKACWASEFLDEDWPAGELFDLIKSMIPVMRDNQPLHA